MANQISDHLRSALGSALVLLCSSALSAEVVIERESDDRGVALDGAWVGIFGGSEVSGKAAERWMAFDTGKMVFSVAEDALPVTVVVLAPESGTPVLRAVGGGDSEMVIVIGQDCGPQLFGRVAARVGTELRVIDGADVGIVGAIEEGADIPEQMRPSWRTSRGLVEMPCMVAGQYLVSVAVEGYLPARENVVLSDELPWSFDVALVPDDRWVNGEVVGPGGNGIEGAKVTGTSATESLHTVSGPDGAFAVGPFSQGDATVFASAGDTVSTHYRVGLPSAWLQVSLVPGDFRSRIIGRVFDQATDVAIETFEVAFHPKDSPMWSRTYESANGEFDVVTESASAVIQVRADGYATWTGAPKLNPGQSRTLDVPLKRGSLLFGRVFASATGAPIEGATVYAQGYLWDGRVLAAHSVVTDSSGIFELRSDGDIGCFGVRAKGFAPKVACSSDGEEPSVGLDAGGEVVGRLALPDGLAVSGSVALGAVAPPLGRVLGLWDLWLREAVEQKTTARDGQFRLGDLAPGTYNIWADSSEGVVEAQTVTVAAGASRTLRLLVEPLASIKGNVSGLSEGEQARLTVHSEESGDHDGHVRWAPEKVGNGTFEIPGVPDGRYVLVAKSDQGRETSVDFEIQDQEDTELEVTFLHSSRLWGRVLSGGQGVRRVNVFARHVDSPMRALGAFTEDNGAYSFSGLADGTHEVVVLGNRFHVDVRGDTEFDLALAAHSVSGVVRAFGRPAAAVRMFARPLDVPAGEPWWTAWPRPGPYVIEGLTGSAGEYRFGGLPEGRYEMVAMMPYFDGGTREVFVNADVEGVDLYLRPTEDLRPVYVVPNSGVAGEEIEMAARGGMYAGLRESGTYLPLDGPGMTSVPGSLEGADLSFVIWHPSRRVVRVPRWDGGPITIRRAEVPESD